MKLFYTIFSPTFALVNNIMGNGCEGAPVSFFATFNEKVKFHIDAKRISCYTIFNRNVK